MTKDNNSGTVKFEPKQDTETTLLKIHEEIMKLPENSRERKIFSDAWVYAMKGGR